MPRYHFNTADGERRSDPEGTELADEDAARREAIHYLGETLRWGEDKLLKTGHLRVEVTDEQGTQLFTLSVVAAGASAKD